MPHIDQLLGHRRRLGEDAEPAERVDALMRGDRSCRHALAADAVKAVAASDEVAVDLQRVAAGAAGHPRLVGEDVVQADLARGVDVFAPAAARPSMRSLVISVCP